MDKDLLNPYGLKNGILVHVDQVEAGLACDCVCPKCKERFVAKKGRSRTHHFAHEKESECTGGYESVIHKLSKKVLEYQGWMRIPKPRIEHNPYFLEHMDYISLTFDRVEVEQKIFNIRPDLIVYKKNVPLIIEIALWHKTEAKKIRKIKEMGISALEIYLYEFRNPPKNNIEHELYRHLVERIDNKEWIYNRKNIFKKKIYSGTGVSHVYEKLHNALPENSNKIYKEPNDAMICRVCGQLTELKDRVVLYTENNTCKCRSCVRKSYLKRRIT